MILVHEKWKISCRIGVNFVRLIKGSNGLDLLRMTTIVMYRKVVTS